MDKMERLFFKLQDEITEAVEDFQQRIIGDLDELSKDLNGKVSKTETQIRQILEIQEGSGNGDDPSPNPRTTNIQEKQPKHIPETRQNPESPE